MRRGGFYATWWCSGFHALWKTLSGSECAVEDAVGMNAMSKYIGTLRPGGCKRCGWSKKLGVRTNRLLGPYK